MSKKLFVIKSFLKEYEKKESINFKATKAQRKIIEENADKYARGDKSKWIRYASMNFEPPKSELKRLRA